MRTDNAGKIHEIMHRLAGVKPEAGTDLGAALHELAATARRRSIVMIISDLFGDEDALQKNIERLRFQGNEVIVFHVLDPNEMEFPFTGTVKFIGLEGAADVETAPASIRKSYLENFNAFRQRIRTICGRSASHYVLCDTSVPLAETLGQYLAFRQGYRTR